MTFRQRPTPEATPAPQRSLIIIHRLLACVQSVSSRAHYTTNRKGARGTDEADGDVRPRWVPPPRLGARGRARESGGNAGASTSCAPAAGGCVGPR